MPIVPKKIRGKWRGVEKDTGRIARRPDGGPIDMGGFKTKPAVMRRISVVNISQARQRGAKIPRKKS